jgi:hypothetical protein
VAASPDRVFLEQVLYFDLEICCVALSGDWQASCSSGGCGARKTKILGASEMTIEKKSLISALKTTMKANAVKEDTTGNATMTSPAQVLPGLKSPGLKGPGLKGPGLKGPGLKGPGLKGPGLKGPGAKGPGAKGPAQKGLASKW